MEVEMSIFQSWESQCYKSGLSGNKPSIFTPDSPAKQAKDSGYRQYLANKDLADRISEASGSQGDNVDSYEYPSFDYISPPITVKLPTPVVSSKYPLELVAGDHSNDPEVRIASIHKLSVDSSKFLLEIIAGDYSNDSEVRAAALSRL